jgi:hypothetical protein
MPMPRPFLAFCLLFRHPSRATILRGDCLDEPKRPGNSTEQRGGRRILAQKLVNHVCAALESLTMTEVPFGFLANLSFDLRFDTSHFLVRPTPDLRDAMARELL